MKLLSLPVLFSILFLSCQGQEEQTGPYQLGFPSKRIALPDEMEEISGIHLVDQDHFKAIQDEQGIIYNLDSASGSISEKTVFGKDGDYEGITMVEDAIWALRSDGNLYSFESGKETEKYKFPEDDFEFEGLCFDKKENRLLLALKKHPSKKVKKLVHIYAFDLKNQEFSEQAVIQIPKNYVHQNFKPSGLSFHPITGDLYIVSSVAKTLLILNSNQESKGVFRLNPFVFRQPEGLTFDEEGNLFISNEENDGPPTVLKFDYQDEK